MPGGDPAANANATRVANLASGLARVGGTATESDRQAVLTELQRLPPEALEALRDHGVRVTVVRNSVVEALPHLADVRPRGWPPGSTWDTVPGLYAPTTNQVIVATRGGAVPATGNGHGAANLVAHETGHALDASVNGHGDAAFVAARNQDLPNLSAYQRQPGSAGPEETDGFDFLHVTGPPVGIPGSGILCRRTVRGSPGPWQVRFRPNGGDGCHWFAVALRFCTTNAGERHQASAEREHPEPRAGRSGSGTIPCHF